MAKQTINLGSGDSRGDGESIRTAFDKCNDNFDELYADISTLDGSKIVYGDLSVTTASASGAGALSYDSSTGTFTFTPAASVAETNDLTASVTWTNIPDAYVPQSAVTQHQAALTITESQISDLSHTTYDQDLNTTDNVEFAGITTSGIVTSGDITAAVGLDLGLWSSDGHDIYLSTINTSATNYDYIFGNNGTLTLPGNIDMGTNVVSDTKVGQWDTAYGWGNHASAGYLTSETTTSIALNSNSLDFTDETGTVTSIDLSAYLDEDSRAITSGTLNPATGIVTYTRDDASTFTLDLSALLDDGPVVSVAGRTGVVTLTADDLTDGSTNAIPTLTQETNWDTAYGWGDHASAGYSLTDTTYSAGNSLSLVGTTFSLSDNVLVKGTLSFEGATDNDYETTLQVVDPTADRLITIPNATGTLALTSAFGNFSISNNTISTNSGDTGIDLVINGATSDDPPALVNKAWRFVNDGSLQFRSPMNIGSEVDATITSTKVGQWDTAYGWGDHSSAGYLTSASTINAATVNTETTDSNQDMYLTFVNSDNSPVASETVYTDESIKYNPYSNRLYFNTARATGEIEVGTGGSARLTLDSVYSSGTFKVGKAGTTGSIEINSDGHIKLISNNATYITIDDGSNPAFRIHSDISMGVNAITDGKVGQWDTAYGWGNHASAGYLTDAYSAGSGLSLSGTEFAVDATVVTTSATQTLSNKTLSSPVVDVLTIADGVQEKYGALTSATGTVTHDCDNGHIFSHSSISADFTANITNLNCDSGYATTITLVLNQGGTAYMPTAVQIAGSAQTITWQGGSAPSGTANGVDVVTFSILNASGTYTVLGSSVSYS